MKNSLLISLLLLFSSFSFAGGVIGIGFVDNIEVESNYNLGHNTDKMTFFSMYGVNTDETENRYMTSGIFLQYGVSDHSYEKRLYNFKDQSIFNLGLTIPMTTDFFMNFGAGFYLRSTQLESGRETESERLINFHLSANKIFYDKLVVGVTYNTALSKLGGNIGYKF